jgi:two-component sensor histidine kinase/heme exporter protein D
VPDVGSPAFSDLRPRLVISPLLGPLLATATGLIDPARHSTVGLLMAYAYFSIVAFVIWTGNSWLYMRLPSREEWLRRPSSRMRALLTSIVLFTIPVALLLVWMWQRLTGDRGTNPYAIPIALVAIIAVAVIITHVYETVFLLRDWESDRLRSARMEQARLEAELGALGREVDPHFLFNNLNALAHLIDERQRDAQAFINALGDTYRYVLDARGCTLVPLVRELEALRRHETLAAIRFGQVISLEVKVDERESQALVLPPVTLAELFQNAIKHNAVSLNCPLRISISVEEGVLVFRNTLGDRRSDRASLGLGLANLSQRVRLATGREASWGSEDGWFVVRVPLLPQRVHA